MRKIVCLILVFVLIYGGNCFAEPEGISNYEIHLSQILNALYEWDDYLVDRFDNSTDVEAKTIIDNAMWMTAAEEQTLMHTDESQNTGSLPEELLLPKEDSYWQGENLYIISGWQITDDNAYVLAEVHSKESYLNATLTINNPSGELYELAILELAKRSEEEAMCLLIEYFAEQGYTSRSAILFNGEKSSPLSMSTLGMTLDVVLDIESWSNGEEMKWTKNLLYPAYIEEMDTLEKTNQ